MTRTRIIIGLDIGTTKIAAAVAKIGDEKAELLAVTSVKYQYKGMLKTRIAQAISEALLKSGLSYCTMPKNVALGFSDCSREYTTGIIFVEFGRITQKHICMAIAAAHNIRDIEHRAIVDSKVVAFEVDDQTGIVDPLGMIAQTLIANTNIVTVNRNTLAVAAAACKQAKLKILRKTASSLASAAAILTNEERGQGVCLLDLGGRYTNMAVYCSGELDYFTSVSWGGNDLTGFIRARLGVSSCELSEAEKIKIAIADGSADKTAEQTILVEKEVTAWMNNLCSILKKKQDSGSSQGLEIFRQKVSQGGIVLTGRTSNLPGLPELLVDEFGVSVRKGAIRAVQGMDSLSDEYASAVGLVLREINAAGVTKNI